jgi:protein-S-isoprenylcysteine O-methyltransferase Ste14
VLQKNMPNKIFAIVNALMALSYSIIGVFLILFPDSYFAQNFLPSKTYVYGLAVLLIVYGLFRAWRVYQKFKDDDDDEYSYYDEKEQ